MGARVPCLPVGVALAFAVGPNPQSWRVSNLVGNQATPDLTFQMSRKRSTVLVHSESAPDGGGLSLIYCEQHPQDSCEFAVMQIYRNLPLVPGSQKGFQAQRGG